MKKLAIFDLDGTLFRWQLFHELVFELKARNYFSEKDGAKLDAALGEWQSRQRDWLSYELVVIDSLKRHLPKIKPSDFEAASLAVLERSGKKVYRYTRELAKTLKADGYHLLAITGSQQEISEPFARTYGFDDCIGRVYERNDGIFTGATTRDVFRDKVKLLKEYASEHDFSFVDSVAIGDSHSDIGMLELVERPIAFNPSAELLDAAIEHGWEIVIERKNIAYHLEKGDDGTFILATTDRF